MVECASSALSERFLLPSIKRAHACWLDDEEKEDCTYACKLVSRVHAIVEVCLTGCMCTCKVAHMHARMV